MSTHTVCGIWYDWQRWTGNQYFIYLKQVEDMARKKKGGGCLEWQTQVATSKKAHNDDYLEE